MKELVETIARALVDHPEHVNVSEEQQRQTRVITLSVHKEDMGKVIGKQGKVATAIRSVVYAAASQQHQHVRLEIAD
ncbi:KH domain-containing protein [Sinobaca sp. H24]|uniref:KH domain-containing protein n=1 Tax=Sinobaca sp. H24 TaxID=2923376 RepID=UPI00207AE96B|nr:KH domain-containing protein [Sinobaca sp. H24]